MNKHMVGEISRRDRKCSVGIEGSAEQLRDLQYIAKNIANKDGVLECSITADKEKDKGRVVYDEYTSGTTQDRRWEIMIGENKKPVLYVEGGIDSHTGKPGYKSFAYTTYTYDDNGRETYRKKSSLQDNLHWGKSEEVTSEYHENGQLRTQQGFRRDFDEIVKFNQEFNDNGKLLSLRTLDQKTGELRKDEKYDYNEKGGEVSSIIKYRKSNGSGHDTYMVHQDDGTIMRTYYHFVGRELVKKIMSIEDGNTHRSIREENVTDPEELSKMKIEY